MTKGAPDYHASIEIIRTLREVFHLPKELIINPNFNQEFVGWYAVYNPTIDTSIFQWSPQSVKFAKNTNRMLSQMFPIPIGVSWFSELSCYVRSTAVNYGLNAFYWYSNESYSIEQLQVTVANDFRKMVLHPTTGKSIKILQFNNYSPIGGDFRAEDNWLADITMVF